MNFEAASNYLLRTINETHSRRQPHRLDRMRLFLNELGDPHLTYPTLLVGGTSGKGSTSTMLAVALQASGKRVGLHTKPHLTSMTERARIDGLAISEEQFGEILGEMMPAIERTTAQENRPSYFETLLAIAFVYFAHEHVDAAVIEVGIGGKLDGTNLVSPEVTVITNTGLDHMETLGDTIEEIAADEAGIARAGVPLVSDVGEPHARAVIEAAAHDAGAPFISVRDTTAIEFLPGEPHGQHFQVTTPNNRYDVALPVLGAFQRRNAATALTALEALGPQLRPTVAQAVAGLAKLNMPGRMEFFPAHPSVLFDIAHNADKAASLAEALIETFPDRRFAFIIAVNETKDPRAILEPLLALGGSYTFTSFSTTGRTAMRPQRLATIASSLGAWGRTIHDPVEALMLARRGADPGTIIVVTGSTFVVAQLRDWWLANVAPERA